MKLRRMKEVIDKAVENLGDLEDAKVEIWVGDKKAYKVGRIGQFGVIPDVTISVGEKIYDSTEEI